ncbi:MAG: hypothetical protein LKG11_00735 [Bacilli bacterium]|nr:hypothetical protein [Bacilli bacterium]
MAYQQWRRYRDTFYAPANIGLVLSQCRDFYEGRHYSSGYENGMPKPTFNICREYVERVTAKICGTKRHVAFLSDSEAESLKSIDDFYEYQMGEMDDEDTVAEITKRGFIDGIGVAFTSYDSDSYGTQGLFRGFLKRVIVPFERTFWSNPFESDPQEMRYLGYYIDMESDAVKEMIEGSEKTKAEKEKLIVPEGYFDSDEYNGSYKNDIDGGNVRVYIRFFRNGGETYFEACTEYCELYESPHPLNPRISEEEIMKKKSAYDERSEGGSIEDRSKSIDDYGTDEAKYLLFTKAVPESDSSYKAKKDKFYRYPVSVFRPYPMGDLIIGQSGVSMLIPNQKIINYTYLLIALIMQNHAMPKVVVKPDALQGQEYDNSPNQVLVDYSSIASAGSGGWGITKLSSGDAVNSNLITIGENFINLTRKIYGFDNIDSDSFSSDTSGYAYSQMVKQMNLILELPQKRLWRYCKDNARTDILYFKHYVDSAKYFYSRSDSEVSLNEDYRQMSQNMIDQGKSSIQKGTKLPMSRKIETGSIENGFFDSEFNVSMEVEQGIAGSELTESQHYNQIWQYISNGNIRADLIKMLVTNDPALTSRTRSRLMASLEELETSQIAQKDQQISNLQQAIQELQSYMKFANQTIQYQQKRQKSTEQAASEQAKVASTMLKNQQQGSQMSESEVKSNNAKGIAGGSFSGSGTDAESIYNTGT